MTMQITTPLFGRALLRALVAMLDHQRDELRLSQFCAALPTKQSHVEYVELWRHLLAVPLTSPSARIIVAQPTPRNPQSAESAAAVIAMRRNGWQVRWSGTGRIHHPKTWIFGCETAIIGSHNLTAAAMLMNNEASLLTRDRAAVSDCVAWFEMDWQKAHERPTFGLA